MSQTINPKEEVRQMRGRKKTAMWKTHLSSKDETVAL